jgi:hypothetical protein
VKPSRGEWDDDVVDRVRASGTTDPLTLELMQEVVYLRGELAKQVRDEAMRVMRETNHRRRHD